MLKHVVTFVTAILVGYLGTGLILKFVNQSPIPTVKSVMPSDAGKYPAMVRLLINEGKGSCSGTVISPTLVLTAAHCLDGKAVVVIAIGDTYSVEAKPLLANARADYGLIVGDFSAFTQLKAQRDPNRDILYFPSDFVMCGFAYGSKTPVCFPALSNPVKYVDRIHVEGQLYAGMSGGPVIDLKTGNIVAVNSAIMPGGVLISPLIGLFVKLGE